MENIDPVYFLEPMVVIAFSVGLAGYWHKKRRLTVFVLLFSLVAYFGAIIAKVLLQAVTYGPFDAAVGGNPAALGAYFGLQTSVFEVGGAYLVARYAFSRGMMKANDAEGYGIGLALWENAVLVGGAALLDYAIYYATLSGSGTAAQQMYAALVKAGPSLFYPPSSALPLIGYAILERISSLLFHLAWGYLCVLAVAFRRPIFLVAALPMGLVDFFVPFESSVGIGAFEALIFVISLACIVVALTLTRGVHRSGSMRFASPPAEPGSTNLRSLFYTNFKRALNFGKIYVVMGMVLPLLLTAELSFANSATASGSAGASVLSEIYPLILPVFVIIGATGPLMIFASDKDKGVYEYMLAYGVDVSTIFWSIIVATLGIVCLVLAVSLVITVTSLALTGGTLSVIFGELVLFYTIPLSFAASMFMSMAGMIWSQLTSRRPGVNSPVGIAPLLGIAPIMIVLLLALGPASDEVLIFVGSVSIAMIWAVVVMASVANKRMQRERFLSNA